MKTLFIIFALTITPLSVNNLSFAMCPMGGQGCCDAEPPNTQCNPGEYMDHCWMGMNQAMCLPF